MSRSKVAEELRAAKDRSTLSLSPEERVKLARELGERGIRIYMAAHAFDRDTAVAALRKLKRNGRPRSRCMEQS